MTSLWNSTLSATNPSFCAPVLRKVSMCTLAGVPMRRQEGTVVSLGRTLRNLAFHLGLNTHHL
jgi:hypothetical protein